jgi:hypothetical protein
LYIKLNVPRGIRDPLAIFTLEITGGTVSPPCPKVIYHISPILIVHSQFDPTSVPVYAVEPAANTPSLSTNIYIGLHAPPGNQDIG